MFAIPEYVTIWPIEVRNVFECPAAIHMGNFPTSNLKLSHDYRTGWGDGRFLPIPRHFEFLRFSLRQDNYFILKYLGFEKFNKGAKYLAPKWSSASLDPGMVTVVTTVTHQRTVLPPLRDYVRT